MSDDYSANLKGKKKQNSSYFLANETRPKNRLDIVHHLLNIMNFSFRRYQIKSFTYIFFF